MECSHWYKQHTELLIAYHLFRYKELNKTLRYKYTPVPAYLQRGPQCGIVALAMTTRDVTKTSVEGLFFWAQRANFTNHGEMFSASEMCQLGRIAFKDPTLKIQVYRGNLDCRFIKEFLLNGGFMLVPYDASDDIHGSPCNKRGLKAHWAAVTGAVEAEDLSFFVIARHGTTLHVQLWRLETLAESNMQLEEASPERLKGGLEYKLPEGGIAGPNGLKGQSVLIYPKGFGET